MAMDRVTTFIRKGQPFLNTGRSRIPFEEMTNLNDYCEFPQTKTCIAGNVAGLCSLWSRKLDRRFHFSDLKNGTYRVTVTQLNLSRYQKRNRSR